MLKEKLNIQSYSASQLIAERKEETFSKNKLVSDIDDNQNALTTAVAELRRKNVEFIIDGHFCLLNKVGEITRISSDTYIALKPDMIILLTEKPEIIAERRLERDNVYQAVSEIKAFQEEEKRYAKEITEQLNIPLVVSYGAEDINRILDYIKAGGY